MTAWRVAAWTHPDDVAGFFQKDASIPFVRFSATDSALPRGRMVMQVPVTYPWQDLISTNDPTLPSETSLIRVYREGIDSTGDPDVEYLLNRFTKKILEDGETVVEISGIDWRLAGLDSTALRWWDWEVGNTNTVQPDWVYGGDNMLGNGSLEENPIAIANAGFEDGLAAPWWAGAVAGVHATIAVQSGTVDTGTFALAVSPLAVEGGASTTFNVTPSSPYTITARVLLASGINYQIGATGPSSMQATSPATLVDLGDLNTWEAQKAIVGTGAWQTITLDFTSGTGQSTSQLSIREAENPFDGTIYYIDVVSVAGIGIGTSPWMQSQTVGGGPIGSIDRIFGGYDIFEVSTDQAHTGSYSLKIDPANIGRRFAGAQQVVAVRPNTIHNASIWVWATAADDFRLVLRGLDESLIASVNVSPTPNTWQEVTLTDVDVGNRTRIIFRFASIEATGNPSIFYIDDGYIAEGMAVDTWGAIVIDMLNDAQVDHPSVPRLPWLAQGAFTGAVDEDAVAWIRFESVTLRRGMKYGSHIFAGVGAELGYEYDLTPNGDTPVWDLAVWNPGGRGAVLTGTAFIVGFGVGGGLISGRTPNATRWLGEGVGGLITEVFNAAQEAKSGIVEDFAYSPDITGAASLLAAANQRLADDLANRIALTVDLDDSGPTPWADFDVGDTAPFHYAGTMVVNDRRITEIGLEATTTDGETFWQPTVTASRLLSGDAAVKEGLYGLLTAYKRIPEEEEGGDTVFGGGEGGQLTVAIAAWNSASTSQERVDFVCDGTNDEEEWGLAADWLSNAGGGRLLVAEGDYHLATGVVFSGNVTIQGVAFATILHTSMTDGILLDIGHRSIVRDIRIGEQVPT